jgi:hypothetical protein
MSCRQGGDKTTTFVPMSCRQDGDKNICLIDKVEKKLLPMSHRQGGDITTTNVLPTWCRQSYYLCLVDKVEAKLLPMSCQQGGDITTTYVLPTRGRQTTTYVSPTRENKAKQIWLTNWPHINYYRANKIIRLNVFGPAHIEKSHFKCICGCIFWQSFMKYGGNKSIKENSLWPWVLIPEDNRHSTVTRKIPLLSVEPVTISYTHYWVHWFLPVKIAWTGTFFIIFIFSLNI